MLIIICITVLAYFIMGKDFSSLLEKVKNIDWREKADELFKKYVLTPSKSGVQRRHHYCSSGMCFKTITHQLSTVFSSMQQSSTL